MTDLLTAKQAASRLAVHVNTVKRMVRLGQIPHYRIGDRGDLRFDPADIDAWLRKRRVEPSDYPHLRVADPDVDIGPRPDPPPPPPTKRKEATE